MSDTIEITSGTSSAKAAGNCAQCSGCGCSSGNLSALHHLKQALAIGMAKLHSDLKSGRFNLHKGATIGTPAFTAVDMAQTAEPRFRHVMRMTVDLEDSLTWYQRNTIDIEMAVVEDAEVPHGLSVELKITRYANQWESIYSWSRQALPQAGAQEALDSLVEAAKSPPFDEAFYGLKF